MPLQKLQELQALMVNCGCHDIDRHKQGNCDKAMTLLEQVIAEAQEHAETESEWRNLALQFDGHRMHAMAHLKMLLQAPENHTEAALQFLSLPPLSGQDVLAERIAAMGKPTSAVDIPPSVMDALKFYADSNVVYITFNKATREADLKHHRTSPDWEEFGEDGRGHERFVVTERKAETALHDLQLWLDEQASHNE